MVPCPYREKWLKNGGDPEAHARWFIPTTRTWSNATFLSGRIRILLYNLLRIRRRKGEGKWLDAHFAFAMAFWFVAETIELRKHFFQLKYVEFFIIVVDVRQSECTHAAIDLPIVYPIREKYKATTNETKKANPKLFFLKFDKISPNFDLPFFIILLSEYFFRVCLYEI